MNRKLLIASLFISAFSFSQEKIPFKDGTELMDLASQTGAKGEFGKSLEILNRISENDSVYCGSLISKSYYLMNLERYEEALEVVNEGLESDCPESDLSYYVNKVVAYINKGDSELALETLDEALHEFPKNSVLWYNKGVALEKEGNFPMAISAFQNAVLFNPGYEKPHLRLGDICYKQNRMAQALMSYDMYLLLNPDGEDAFRVLRALNDLVNNKNPNSPSPDFQVSEDTHSFEDLDLILNNKLALNKEYKVENEIQIALTRQNHVLMEQLQAYEDTEGWWSNTYVPLFRWIFQQGHFDEFTYTISYSIENEKYKKIINKNMEGITSFIEAYVSEWRQILEKNKVRLIMEDEGMAYSYTDLKVNGIGKRKGDLNIGDWRFYDADGRLTGAGSYNDQGNRQGKWIWYDLSGEIREYAHYQNGLLEGENKAYFSNGRIRSITGYTNDNLEGEYRLYNEKGALMQKKVFKNGELNGPYQEYFQVGEILPEFDITYRDGLIEEKAVEYYANGDVFAEMDFKNGKQHGSEKKYHKNNNLFSETLYINGEPYGTYETFYSNGKLQERGQYESGKLEGRFEAYYENGQLESEGTYSNGVPDGVTKYFDSDGRKHYEYDWKKGEIISYRYYNKNGDILAGGKRKGGEFYYKSYSAYGEVVAEGLYDISGGRKGEWKYYSGNGVLTGQGNFTEDRANGTYTEYYDTGKKKSVVEMEMDDREGYFTEYHLNEKMKSQGWYREDKEHGEWRTYYVDGTLESVKFFHKGQLHGEQKFYAPDGKLRSIFKYEYDEPVSEILLDTEGKEFQRVTYLQEEDAYSLVQEHFNNTTDTRATFLHGIKHGLYEEFNYYGQKVNEGNFWNGAEEGEWITYYDSGNTKARNSYRNGIIHGPVIMYHENGEVESEYFYEYGVPSGTWKSYYENGNLMVSTHYENGAEHGRKEFYGREGNLQLVRIYDAGRLIGYTHLDSSSQELPMIPLENETGLITAYYNNGKISRKMEYVNGRIEGLYDSFYYSGQPETSLRYESGEYCGSHLTFFSGGGVKTQTPYLFGKVHGTVKTFYENGSPKKEENYLNDIKSGDSVYYNETGEPTRKEKYFNGNIYYAEVL